MGNKTRVNIKTFPNGKIELEVHGLPGKVARFVVDTHDEPIRAALIKMGWTPPRSPPLPSALEEEEAWFPPGKGGGQ